MGDQNIIPAMLVNVQRQTTENGFLSVTYLLDFQKTKLKKQFFLCHPVQRFTKDAT